jgi:glutathione transport system substrate-binding protein
MTGSKGFKRRDFLGSALGLAAAPGLAALAAGARPAEAADAPHGDLVVGVPDNLTGLDPADVNDTLSQSACRTMMQGLYGFDKDMKLIPVLAESHQANDKATEFTFKLRKGIAFHDGTPFNADAVKANFARWTNPANHLKRSSLFSMVDHVDVIDDATVKVVLKTPFGAFIPTMAHPAAMMISPKAMQQYGKDLIRNPVGTGPYKFVSWSADTLKMTRNDKYWKPGLPKLNSVTFRSVPENGARVAMLQAGEAHFIYPMPPEMMKVVEHNPNITIINAPSIFVRYAAMNVTKKPFNDLRVRQALNYAVDKKAYTHVVYNGFADQLDAPLPPKLAFYSKQGDWPYDPKKAKELLAAAGYPNGFETEMWSQNNTQAIRSQQFLQQQLGAVGVKVKVVPLESGLLQSKIWTVQKPEDSQLQMYWGGWSSSTGDADWGLRPLFWGKGAPPVLYNVGYYHNPDVDKDLEAALETADADQRRKLYADAQARIWKDAPWIFLAVDHILAGQSKKLSGMYQIADGGLLIEEAALSA